MSSPGVKLFSSLGITGRGAIGYDADMSGERDMLTLTEAAESVFEIGYAALAAVHGRWAESGARRRSMRWIIAK